MEYEKKHYGSGTSTTAKVAAALGGTALGIGVLNGGGILNGLVAPRVAPTYSPALGYAPPVTFAAEQAACGYVTEKEMRYVRENTELLADNAKLRSINYTNEAVQAATAPLVARICNLETAAAVNAARDSDFRAYVNREFVHQPKATMRESIVTCQQCGCDNCCCGHGHGNGFHCER